MHYTRYDAVQGFRAVKAVKYTGIITDHSYTDFILVKYGEASLYPAVHYSITRPHYSRRTHPNCIVRFSTAPALYTVAECTAL